MKILATVTYPLKSMKEAGSVFVKAMETPLPDYAKFGDVYTRYGGKGVIAFTIWDVEKGREDDGNKFIAEWYVRFGEIDGYEIKLRTVLTAMEALPLIGL